jgi:hypothetical protein
VECNLTFFLLLMGQEQSLSLSQIQNDPESEIRKKFILDPDTGSMGLKIPGSRIRNTAVRYRSPFINLKKIVSLTQMNAPDTSSAGRHCHQHPTPPSKWINGIECGARTIRNSYVKFTTSTKLNILYESVSFEPQSTASLPETANLF